MIVLIADGQYRIVRRRILDVEVVVVVVIGRYCRYKANRSVKGDILRAVVVYFRKCRYRSRVSERVIRELYQSS